jgi:hypothetical protein
LAVLTAGAVLVGCGDGRFPAPAGSDDPVAAVEQAQIPGYIDPAQVQFTLEGCRNDGSILLPINGKFVCPDAAYTTGNLGKGWNELDLVPHRLVTEVGTQVGATADFNVIVAADNVTSGKLGYDVISVPVVNAALSDASCTVSAGPLSTQGSAADPFGGGTDVIIYRVLTIHQNKGDTCVFDYYQRLGLGSHLYPGSSLQSYMFEKSDFSTGKRTLSIPVKEILPQSIAKDMSATQGAGYAWDVTKGPAEATVSFPNTCDPAQPTSKSLEITVTYKRLPPVLGSISVITHIYATNPASRVITTSVTDVIYSGTTQLDSASSGPIDVPANTTDFLLLTHTATVPANSTDLNDIATATYTDKVTGLPVPGSTTAKASATPEITTGNATAVVNDVESITGAGFAFSVDSFSGTTGAFDGGYVAGTKTSANVSWTSNSVSGNGSVTFDKTVYAPVPSVASGKLHDVAKVTGSEGFTIDASLDVNLSTNALVTLRINKSLTPPLASGSQVFGFVVKDSLGNVVATPSITFAAGEASKYVDVGSLAPGSYTVSENAVEGWVTPAPQTVEIKLPSCSGSVSFVDVRKGQIVVKKVTVPAGDPTAFAFSASYDADGFSLKDTESNSSGALQPGSYTVAETVPAAWELTSLVCVSALGTSSADVSVKPTAKIPLAAGDTVTCTFTDTKRANAHIVICKATPPIVDPPFPFEASYDKDGFALSVGECNDSGLLAAGAYTVKELPTAGWMLVDVVCVSKGGKSSFDLSKAPLVAINLADADTVTCTFTNDQLAGALTVRKVTPDCDTEAIFNFNSSMGGFGLNNGQSISSGAAPSGSYFVTELPTAGWKLDRLHCISQLGTSSFAINGATVTVQYKAGDKVVCTFTNVRSDQPPPPDEEALLRIVKTVSTAAGAVPPRSGESFLFVLRRAADPIPQYLELEYATYANQGHVDFGTELVPGVVYQACEQVAAGWQSSLNATLIPTAYGSFACQDFQVAAGEIKSIAVLNTPPLR